MQTLQIDDRNNLVLSNTSLVVIDNVNACAQDTKTRVALCLGENPYNTNEGIDFFNNILGRMGGVDFIRESLRKRILDNDEIIEIRNLSIEKNGDVLNVVADIMSIYGVFEV